MVSAVGEAKDKDTSEREKREEIRLALGEALRALRERAGITQEQLAHRMNMTPSYVSQVECGRRGLQWYTVLRFLTALDATLNQLADELLGATNDS